MFETFTTIGYGDFGPSTEFEIAFTYFVQLTGVGFFAIFMAYVTFILSQDDSIEELTEVYWDKLTSLIAKIEKANAH